ncbi:MAG: PQQ-dependent sugar dehydrogenase [Xanthobacteraceae bacterium]|nr:PQQ-dependent sugar dehydrogenase [Xanthobacteraceae bacterium]
MRLNLDGSVPEDNPFAQRDGAGRRSGPTATATSRPRRSTTTGRSDRRNGPKGATS